MSLACTSARKRSKGVQGRGRKCNQGQPSARGTASKRKEVLQRVCTDKDATKCNQEQGNLALRIHGLAKKMPETCVTSSFSGSGSLPHKDTAVDIHCWALTASRSMVALSAADALTSLCFRTRVFFQGALNDAPNDVHHNGRITNPGILRHQTGMGSSF